MIRFIIGAILVISFSIQILNVPYDKDFIAFIIGGSVLFLIPGLLLIYFGWRSYKTTRFIQNSLKFLIPYVISMLLYIVILLFIGGALNTASIEFLFQLKEAIIQIKSSLPTSTIKGIGILGIFVGLYLLSMLKMRLAIKKVYIFVVLLCSSVLFIPKTGDLSLYLDENIKNIRDEYVEICKEIEPTIYEEIAVLSYKKVYDSFPQSYHDSWSLTEQIKNEIDSLRHYFKHAQSYGIESAKAQSILDFYKAHEKKVSGLKVDFEAADGIKTKLTEIHYPPPFEITGLEIREVKTTIDEYRKSLPSRIIMPLIAEDCKQLIWQIPKVLPKKDKKAAFRSCIESYPILKPIVDVFVTSFDDEIVSKVSIACDSIIRSIDKNPGNLLKSIRAEALKTVDSRSVQIPAQILIEAERTSKRLQDEISSIQIAKSWINQQIKRLENSTVDGLITQLTSSNEQRRLYVSSELASKGEKLTESQVAKLINTMKVGKGRWSKYLYRSGHCTWYEITTIRYYAAESLINMKSQYVNEKIREEAWVVKSKNKFEEKVTDPGWI